MNDEAIRERFKWLEDKLDRRLLDLCKAEGKINRLENMIITLLFALETSKLKEVRDNKNIDSYTKGLIVKELGSR